MPTTNGEQGLTYRSLLTPSTITTSACPFLQIPGFQQTDSGHIRISVTDNDLRVAIALFAQSYWTMVAALHDPDAVAKVRARLCDTVLPAPKSLVDLITAMLPKSVDIVVLAEWAMEVLLDTNSALVASLNHSSEVTMNTVLVDMSRVNNEARVVGQAMGIVAEMHRQSVPPPNQVEIAHVSGEPELKKPRLEATTVEESTNKSMVEEPQDVSDSACPFVF